MLKLAELFAGTGAFSLAFKRTGRVATVFANDMDADAGHLFNTNHDIYMTCADIHTLRADDLPPFDILTAGFPCQAFSVAGERRGFDDERSSVIWKMFDILRHCRPRAILLENVKNLKTHDDGRTLATILQQLGDIGYITKYRVLNTCRITNIPQNRERLFIVGFLEADVAHRFSWPTTPTTPMTSIREMVGDDRVDDRYYYTPSSKIWDRLAASVTEPFTAYQYRRGVVRMNKNGVVPTLTATMGTGGHNIPIIKDNHGIRKLTPRECFTLQGFPADYQLVGSDSTLYRLCGNGVTVAVVDAIAHRIVDALTFDRPQECDLLLQYYQQYLRSCELSDKLSEIYKCKTIRRPVFPEVLSENMIYSILKSRYNVVYDINTGDLIIHPDIRIEVKCSSSSGPLSFGPNQQWSRLYCIDASNFVNDQCVIYEIRACKKDFEQVKMNKTETFGDQCLACRRPRLSLNHILDIFQNSTTELYRGSITALLSTTATTKK